MAHRIVAALVVGLGLAAPVRGDSRPCTVQDGNATYTGMFDPDSHIYQWDQEGPDPAYLYQDPIGSGAWVAVTYVEGPYDDGEGEYGYRITIYGTMHTEDEFYLNWDPEPGVNPAVEMVVYH